LLKTIDMPFTLPTIGLSEISTTRIVNQSPFHEFAQPCSRGKVKKPCMNCYQCFRKSLLERVTMNRPLDNKFLDKLFNIEEVNNVINTSHIYNVNVLAINKDNYNERHKKKKELKKKSSGEILKVDWRNKYY